LQRIPSNSQVPAVSPCPGFPVDAEADSPTLMILDCPLSLACPDGDLAFQSFGDLGQVQSQHPILDHGLDPRPVDLIRQGKGPLVVAHLVLGIGQAMAFRLNRLDVAIDSQHIVFQGNIDRVSVNAGGSDPDSTVELHHRCKTGGPNRMIHGEGT
jgi:hypothetical protein